VQTIEPSGPSSENQAAGTCMGNYTCRKCEPNGLRCSVYGTESARLPSIHWMQA
jgi:hypothetical protein